MISSEDARWKLAVCETCESRRTMLEADSSCLSCGRERRPTLSAEDVRWIVAFRGPAGIVRAAWTLASESMDAAVGLDLKTGAITAHRWPSGEDVPRDETEDVLILAVCPAHRQAELPKLLMAGAEERTSAEDAEELAAETVVRSALGDGEERFWEGVESQLGERAQR